VLNVKPFDWLRTSAGEWIVAGGIASVVFSLFIFMFQDLWILFTGNLPHLGLREVWYPLVGGLAALFSVVCVFVCDL
jgi:hypothetical protein